MVSGNACMFFRPLHILHSDSRAEEHPGLHLGQAVEPLRRLGLEPLEVVDANLLVSQRSSVPQVALGVDGQVRAYGEPDRLEREGALG
jgi:hypothetical protein